MNTYPEMNRQIVGLLRTNGSPTCLYAAARIEELEAQVAAAKDEQPATPDEKAIRIVKALECYASGNWTWLLTEPHLLLDVSAISRDYTRLRPYGFRVAAEQAKALFVQAVIVDSPWLTEWEHQARFFTCNKCHADRVAIPTKPKPRCPNCGRALSHPQTLKDMERNWILVQYWLDEITEAEAAKSLNMTVIELHQTAVKKFGKLHVNEGEQHGNLE